MELTPTAVLLVFLAGFVPFRGRPVVVAAVAALALGALLANDWLWPVVHTLAGALSSLT